MYCPKKKEITVQRPKPNFCIICFLGKNNAKVDEHHVCEDCRKGSNEVPRRLPAITLKNGNTYFIDERLGQLGNVHNPNDYMDFDRETDLLEINTCATIT